MIKNRFAFVWANFTLCHPANSAATPGRQRPAGRKTNARPWLARLVRRKVPLFYIKCFYHILTPFAIALHEPIERSSFCLRPNDSAIKAGPGGFRWQPHAAAEKLGPLAHLAGLKPGASGAIRVKQFAAEGSVSPALDASWIHVDAFSAEHSASAMRRSRIRRTAWFGLKTSLAQRPKAAKVFLPKTIGHFHGGINYHLANFFLLHLCVFPSLREYFPPAEQGSEPWRRAIDARVQNRVPPAAIRPTEKLGILR
jgi:hypothetical protein